MFNILLRYAQSPQFTYELNDSLFDLNVNGELSQYLYTTTTDHKTLLDVANETRNYTAAAILKNYGAQTYADLQLEIAALDKAEQEPAEYEQGSDSDNSYDDAIRTLNIDEMLSSRTNSASLTDYYSLPPQNINFNFFAHTNEKRDEPARKKPLARKHEEAFSDESSANDSATTNKTKSDMTLRPRKRTRYAEESSPSSPLKEETSSTSAMLLKEMPIRHQIDETVAIQDKREKKSESERMRRIRKNEQLDALNDLNQRHGGAAHIKSAKILAESIRLLKKLAPKPINEAGKTSLKF